MDLQLKKNSGVKVDCPNAPETRLTKIGNIQCQQLFLLILLPER